MMTMMSGGNEEGCAVCLDLDGHVQKLSKKASILLGFEQSLFDQNQKKISLDAIVHRDFVPIFYSNLAEMLTQKINSKQFVFNAITDYGCYFTLKAEAFLDDLDSPSQFIIQMQTPLENGFEDPKNEIFYEEFIAHLSPNHEFQVVSPYCSQFVGWKPSELLGRSILDFLDPQSHYSFLTNFRDVSFQPQTSKTVSGLLFKSKRGALVEFSIDMASIATLDSGIVLCTFHIQNIYHLKPKAFDNTFESVQTISLPEVEEYEDAEEEIEEEEESTEEEVTKTSKKEKKEKTKKKANNNGSMKKKKPKQSKMPKSKNTVLNLDIDTSPSSSTSTITVQTPSKKKRPHEEDKERTPSLDGSSSTTKSIYRPSKRTDLKCEFCGATESPEWRRGPAGPNTLCNACGIKYAKKEKQMREQKGEPLTEQDKRQLFEMIVSEKRQKHHV